MARKQGTVGRRLGMTVIETGLDGSTLLSLLQDQQYGPYGTVPTPWGSRPLVYADDTASGRSLKGVETLLADAVLPYYANTHSESSFSGRHTTALRESARATIRHVVGASQDHCVIFTGAGATAAINLLARAMGLLDSATESSDSAQEQRPVVFIGPYEHHANELPWREANVDVVPIGFDADGHIDRDVLAKALGEYASRPLRIGAFSAASNVTGLISDVTAISGLLKQHGALSFWDYAAGGPYLPIDMVDDNIDAIFLSPHKFAGGPGAAGVLVAHKSLFRASRPVTIGGGTVTYVTPSSHHWRSDIQAREEGGTPDILGAIRAGMAFAIKKAVGHTTIHRIEQDWRARATSVFQKVPTLSVLGVGNSPALPIFAFNIIAPNDSHGSGEHSKVLHYGFVAALLNDLFGLQVRGGCSCAGPYGHHLLKLGCAESQQLSDWVHQGWGCMRPGWVRFNLHWLMTDAEVDYVVQAVALVARDGWRLLPSYRLDPKTGVWRFRDMPSPDLPSIDQLMSRLQQAKQAPVLPSPFEPDVLLATAREVLAAGAPPSHQRAAQDEWSCGELSQLPSPRWFLTPPELPTGGYLSE